MKTSPGRTRRRLATVIGVGLLVSALLYVVDRRSIERANRLYREGQVTAAMNRYARLDPGPDGAESYNLGTSLLALGDAEADAHLIDGTRGTDSITRQKAYYNLAYAQLVRVDPSLAQDSALDLLKQAVSNGRVAVRLDPEDVDALWNLTLAQRMLDSLTTLPQEAEGQESAGKDETVIDLVALARSEEGTGQSGEEPEQPPPMESSGVRQAAAQGARESWATQDPGSMSPVDAMALLASLADSPERLVHGILWSRRPDVAWWSGQAYPGGNW